MKLFHPLFCFREKAHAFPQRAALPAGRCAAGLAFAGFLFLNPAFADRPFPGPWDFPQPHPVGEHLDVSTLVVLRPVTAVYDAPPRPAEVIVPEAARVEISTPLADAEITSITWFKDDAPLPLTTKTLVIPRAEAADAGVYTARVERADQSAVLFASAFEQIRILVGDVLPRKIINLSARTTINPSNPSFIVGFVVDSESAHRKGTATLLIRAIGPSLAAAGVPGTLSAPRVALFNSQGTEIKWPEVYIPEWNPYEFATLVAPRVGAAPLQPGSQDFAILYQVPPGGYTAHITSDDGDSGDVVFEIFEVPDALIPRF